MKSLAERGGVRTAFLAAILFGISTPLAKGLLAGISPQILAGLFYLGSGIGLSLLWRLRRGAVEEAPLTRVDAPWLTGALVFGGILAPVLLLFGLQRTLASNASLLLNLESVFTVFLAWLVFHENLDRRFALGIAGIFAGGVLISWQGYLAGGDIVGPLAVAGACLCWAIDNNLTQRVSAGDPMQVAAVKGLVGGVINLALGIWLGSIWPAAAWAAAGLAVGFFCYGLSLVFFVLALRALGTSRTGAYFSIAPFIGALVGLLVWRDAIAPLFLAGSLAMVVGVWLCITERHEHAHVHEVMYHSHRHAHDEHHQHQHGPGEASREPHTHPHEHARFIHRHGHTPDIHHRHQHEREAERDT